MAYNQLLEERIRLELIQMGVECAEKKMFGGIAFMVEDRMFSGIVRDDLMVRVPHDQYEEILTRPYVRPMDFTARPMKGFIYVAWEGLQAQPALLRTYLQLGLAYLDSPEGRAAAAKKAKTKKQA
jgi:TfoX/Sxy family transcriptional regulator of competence genes